MIEAIFVTGATGFIGQSLIPHLLTTPERRVKALCRQSVAIGDYSETGFEVVTGDLLEPAAWRRALDGVDTVIHLAAATGRATPDEFERANVAASRKLLDACGSAGVRRFLYVSTVAAGYADQSHYTYAKSKARAETLVRESGLDFAIIRPTIVLGARSPIWLTLNKIASLPLIPLPQKDRPVEVQPVHVDDVVRAIALVLEVGHFCDEILDLGGPYALPFAEFLSDIHQSARGKPAKILTVPLSPIRSVLAMMEPVLRPLMPVTAGQLAVFANDSTAAPNWLMDQLRDTMATPNEIIERLTGGPSSATTSPRKGPVEHQTVRPLADNARLTLEAECSVFTRYLVETEPTTYVISHYIKATLAHGLAFDRDFAPYDRTMLHFARRNWLFARWADAYSSVLHRGGVLRRKLVVLAAILEHVPPTSEIFDRPFGKGSAAALRSLVTSGTAFGLSFIVGAIIFVPLRLVRRRSVEQSK
jgi:NADH dehydrogenase